MQTILSLCKLAAVYEQIDAYLAASLAERKPDWRVPQLGVLGLACAGKSRLLERLLLLSVFPCRGARARWQRCASVRVVDLRCKI